MHKLSTILINPCAIYIDRVKRSFLQLALMTKLKPVQNTVFAHMALVSIYGQDATKMDYLYYPRHIFFLSITLLLSSYFIACFFIPQDNILLKYRFVIDFTAYINETSDNSMNNFHQIALMIVLVTVSNHIFLNWRFSGAIRIQIALLSDQLTHLILLKPNLEIIYQNQIKLFAKYFYKTRFCKMLAKYIEKFLLWTLCCQGKRKTIEALKIQLMLI